MISLGDYPTAIIVPFPSLKNKGMRRPVRENPASSLRTSTLPFHVSGIAEIGVCLVI